METIEGQSVVVTGAGGGIGAALARSFAGRGARVVVNDLDTAKACAVAEEIGGIAVPGDASRTVQAREALGGATDIYGANAGMAPAGGPETENAVWDAAWDVNAAGRAGDLVLAPTAMNHIQQKVETSAGEAP